MKINGYDINYDEAELKDKMENQTLDVRLISPDFEGYKNLSEGNKKALAHLVAAARMVNDVALEQDHPMNLPQKRHWQKRRPPAVRMRRSRLNCSIP